MEWTEPPRLVLDPSPTPRSNIAPIAITVRSPVRRDLVGHPNVAVGRLFLPSAVIVEVAVGLLVNGCTFLIDLEG